MAQFVFLSDDKAINLDNVVYIDFGVSDNSLATVYFIPSGDKVKSEGVKLRISKQVDRKYLLTALSALRAGGKHIR
jgi:hypothetical protein